MSDIRNFFKRSSSTVPPAPKRPKSAGVDTTVSPATPASDAEPSPAPPPSDHSVSAAGSAAGPGASTGAPAPPPAAPAGPCGAPSLDARDPRVVACWNVNGLRTCLETASTAAAIRAFLEENNVDVLFLSEVRLVAANPKSPAAAQGHVDRSDAKSRAEGTLLDRALAPSGCFHGFKCHLSLARKRYAGTAMLYRPQVATPRRIHYNLPRDALRDAAAVAPGKFRLGGPSPQAHDEEGRVILCEWRTFRTLHTYSPNNGTAPAAYERRRQWDQRLTAWLADAAAATQADRALPLIYLGDLNVAHLDADLSHPQWFKAQMPSNSGCAGDAGQPGCTPNERLRFSEMLERGALLDVYRHLNPMGDPPTGAPEGHDLAENRYTWRGHPGRDVAEAGKYFRRGMRIDHLLVYCPVPEQSQVPACGVGPEERAETLLAANPGSSTSDRDAGESEGFRECGERHADECGGTGKRADCGVAGGAVGGLVGRVLRAEICGRGESAADPSFMGSDHCPMIIEIASLSEAS